MKMVSSGNRGTMRTMQTMMALAIASVAVSASADPAEVTLIQSARDRAITEGATTLAADPDTVYRAVSDYHRWSAMFPDIRQVIVTSRSGDDARVTFIHADGSRDNVHFRNQPAARMVWFEDTGGDAEVWAEIVFLPGNRPGTTRLRSRLYADVHGFKSLFVSDRKIRRLREQRVQADLSQLRAYFAREVEATLPPDRQAPSSNGP
jgi:hypothetical protein